MNQEIIYLDNNATTPIDPRVLEEMMPFLTHNFANAASTHRFGVSAHEAVKKARQQVADLIGADTHEITFTSGATEAINIAIKGIAEAYSQKGKHIVTVSTEHSAVLDTCRYLETKGFEVTYLPVQNDGLLDFNVVKQAIRSDTILVSVMHVNNETGVIQPIQEISEFAHGKGALFMSDCTQSVGKIPVNVDELGIDLLCFSAHKIYGPKGVGALFIRQRKNRIKIPALLHGGGHERGMRSGTLNVPGIVGLGKACKFAHLEMAENEAKIREMRDYLEAELLKIEGTWINGNRDQRLYNVTNIGFEGVDSEALIMGLSNPEADSPMITVSNGSACTAASIEPSHVLLAMGLSEFEAFNCIRLSNCDKLINLNHVILAIKKNIVYLRSLNTTFL
ncbi:cysteine desulfurase family protein [Algoriphagus sp.]|uniref:cysteine desulfurase family protein n=1 Tax=Algoriphagus sp. TaxID=1872435 RepID=UPI002724551F|nr:cysteine desulfurase family protein [Algoriphagus sp.]MDO8968492.1 cysteine desulfurase family protein [Algoriphagus sp.]MDP3200731.1 cysteine desulfurase family protein [Algoriphagus sp.]